MLNEETIVAFSLLSIFWAIAKYGGPMYKEWADGQINKMKGILNSARQDHTNAVQTRIESVKELGGVVDITKNLFEVSKVRYVVLYLTTYPSTLAYTRPRKPPNWRPKLSSSSKELLWFRKLKPFLTRGYGMKDK